MNCRGPNCGREMLVGLDSKGTRHPLDPRAQVYRMVGRDPDGTIRVARAEDCYVSHFVTCPDHAEFSRGKRRQPSPVANPVTLEGGGS